MKTGFGKKVSFKDKKEKGKKFVQDTAGGKKSFKDTSGKDKTFDSVDELTGAEKKRLTQDMLKANKSVGYVKKKKKRRGNK